MHFWKKTIKNIFIFFILLIITLIVLCIILNVTIIISGIYRTKKIDEIENTSTAIVLGAAVLRDKTMSPVLADRAQTALDLYTSGKVRKILVSGSSQTVESDEVSPVRRFLVAQGVAPQDIFLDHAGLSTYETMYRARYIFGIEQAVVVTQSFHLPRALFLANRFNISAVGVSADKRSYLRRNYSREWLARPYAVWQIIAKKPARILGQKIPISGDGRTTWYFQEQY